MLGKHVSQKVNKNGERERQISSLVLKHLLLFFTTEKNCKIKNPPMNFIL